MQDGPPSTRSSPIRAISRLLVTGITAGRMTSIVIDALLDLGGATFR